MQIVVSIIFNYIILMSDDDDRLDLVPKYINSVLAQRLPGLTLAVLGGNKAMINDSLNYRVDHYYYI